MNTFVNFVSEHYNIIMTVLVIGIVIEILIAIWIKVQQRAGRFPTRKPRKGKYNAPEHLGRFGNMDHGRRTNTYKAQGIAQEPTFSKDGGIVFPDVG